MNEERLRILQLVADGKVDPEGADGLLAALEPQAPLPAALPLPPQSAVSVGVRGAPGHHGVAQSLRIILHGEDGDEVDVTCPIAMAKAARHLMPESARHVLEKFGLELEPILDSLAQGAPPGNLITAKTEDGDEFQIRLE